MINAKEAPLYKGFVKIFFFSLLAMVFGFLGWELRALKADALTSSVLPPRSAAQGPWMPESSPPQKLAILRAHDRRARALSPAPLYSLRECGGAPLSPLPSLALAHPIDPPIAVVARISLTARLLITHTSAHLLFDFTTLIVGRPFG